MPDGQCIVGFYPSGARQHDDGECDESHLPAQVALFAVPVMVVMMMVVMMMSARSLGEINVQVILEALGGGGNSTTAGGRVENADPLEVGRRLTEAIDEYCSQ